MIELDVARCTAADVGISIKPRVEGATEEAQDLIDVINAYLSEFAKPVENDSKGFLFGRSKCLNCDSPLGGALGSFTWGIANGEGFCSTCGWPARAYHDIKDDEGSIFDRRLEFVLQYHPQNVDQTKLSKGRA